MRVLKHIKCTLPCMDHYPHTHIRTYACTHCPQHTATLCILYYTDILLLWGQMPIQLFWLSCTNAPSNAHVRVLALRDTSVNQRARRVWYPHLQCAWHRLRTCSDPAQKLQLPSTTAQMCAVKNSSGSGIYNGTLHLRCYNVSHYISHCNQKSYDLKTTTRRQEEGTRTSLVTL